MNEQQKAMLDYKLQQQKGAAIIDGTQDSFRQDGYTNMLNKYGTKQDNSMTYEYVPEGLISDMELIRLYEGNGLFTKIIDRPAEEAVKHGLEIDFGNDDISEYVNDQLDNLGFEDKFATAEKWARLFGGSIIVMLVDDGRGLEEPLDWNSVRSIEELRVFERAIVQPDYTSMYHFHFLDTMKSGRGFDEPEYYHVYSMYGYFTVHRSRCLVFRNGRLPEQTTDAIYRHWGIPEYVKIKRALRECVTSHENGVKLLERCVQAIYKMKNLANMLSTVDGENKVLQRLQVIDMARSILNSIAIDEDGEDYSFQSFAMAGVKDVLDSTCNMLSAVTDIPQTILFGRSPAGMNSTGESDMENYYNMVENIQKQNMKVNARTVIDLILIQGQFEGRIEKTPKYKVKFAALWSTTEAEQASVDQTKAQTEYTKAQTAQVYMESNVLDPSEVRNALIKEGDFAIEEAAEHDLNLLDDTFDFGIDSPIHIHESGSGRRDSFPNHEGRPGEVGGSLPKGNSFKDGFAEDLRNAKNNAAFGKAIESRMKEMPVGTKIKTSTHSIVKVGDDEYQWQFMDEPPETKNTSGARNAVMKGTREGSIQIDVSSEQVASELTKTGELDPDNTSVKIMANKIETKNELSGKSEEEISRYVSEIAGDGQYEMRLNGTLGNEIASNIANKPPESMSEKEFNDYCKKEGTVKMYRGIQDLYDDDGNLLASVENISDQFQNGREEAVMGGGNYGSGYHFSTSKGYAEGFGRTTNEVHGMVLECALKPTAKAIDYHELKKRTPEGEPYHGDTTAWALAHGYDVITGNDHVFNVINRNSVVMKKVPSSKTDEADYPAGAVLIIHDGKILCASRRNGEGVCGPGGHVEAGETMEGTAIREAMEEFNIVPLNLQPLGAYKGSTGLYLPSMVYWTDQFSGIPEADGNEMLNARWMSVEELDHEQLYPPFEESVNMLINLLTT